MSRRTKDWNQGLAKDLRSKEFARHFIEECLDQGMSLQEVLTKVIKAYGIKEFAVKVKLPASNVLRTINAKHNPTIESLNRLLKPFLLKLSIAPIGAKFKNDKIAA